MAEESTGDDYGINAGVYTFADNRYSIGNKSVDIGGEVMEVTKGIKFNALSPPLKSLSLGSVAVNYNIQGTLRESTEAEPSGAITDIVNMRFSTTGVGWGYVDDTYLNGKSWSDELPLVVGGRSDESIFSFVKSGGLAFTNGYLSLIIETRAALPFVIEGVALNG